MPEKLKKGQQIYYVPRHLSKDNLDAKGVEQGFIASGPTSDGSYFCRYFVPSDPRYLRDKANSQKTPFDCIVVCDGKKVEEHHPQDFINFLIEQYC